MKIETLLTKQEAIAAIFDIGNERVLKLMENIYKFANDQAILEAIANEMDNRYGDEDDTCECLEKILFEIFDKYISDKNCPEPILYLMIRIMVDMERKTDYVWDYEELPMRISYHTNCSKRVFKLLEELRKTMQHDLKTDEQLFWITEGYLSKCTKSYLDMAIRKIPQERAIFEMIDKYNKISVNEKLSENQMSKILKNIVKIAETSEYEFEEYSEYFDEIYEKLLSHPNCTNKVKQQIELLKEKK